MFKIHFHMCHVQNFLSYFVMFKMPFHMYRVQNSLSYVSCSKVSFSSNSLLFHFAFLSLCTCVFDTSVIVCVLFCRDQVK
jgi:hypothetical protein